MKWHKIIVWVLIVFVGLFFLFAVWYKCEYAMDVVEPYTVHSPELDHKLLIASQGSVFKDSLTKNIVMRKELDSVFIKGIDVSGLSDIDLTEYEAILLVHTWEYSKPPEEVQSFMDKNAGYGDKIVVLTTSGEGSYKMDNIDALTGESKLGDVPLVAERIMKRLMPLMVSKK